MDDFWEQADSELTKLIEKLESTINKKAAINQSSIAKKNMKQFIINQLIDLLTEQSDK